VREDVVKTSRRMVRSSIAVVLAMAVVGAFGPPAGASAGAPLPIPKGPSPTLGGSDWPMFHNSVDRLGLQTTDDTIDTGSTANMSLKWEYPSDGSIYSSPVVSDGVVYFGSDDNNVYAVDADTGALEWTFTTGDLVRSSASVVGGVVYIGSDDNNVYALNAATGAKIWSFAAADDIELSSPLVTGGKVYVGSLDGNVYALDSNTGAKLWSVNTWAARGSFSISGSTVYVGSDKSTLFALDADTGATKWTATTGDRIKTTPTVFDGVVYVGSDDGHVYAFDAASGALQWTTDLSSQCGMVRSTPSVYDGKVYVVTAETCPMDAHFYALDAATGAQTCNHELADYATSSVAIVNGVAFVGSYSHQLYAFDTSDCEKLWDSGFTLISGGISSSPAVAHGAVYVGSLDNGLYSFAPNASPASTFISMTDSTYNPDVVIAHDIGTAAQWSNDGSKSHDVVDNQGMGLYDSGTIAKGDTWQFTFVAAGIYKYHCTLHSDMTGKLKAPMILSPSSGSESTTYAITWATEPPPSGYVYDVKIRRPDSTTWELWQSDVTTYTATFVPDAGKGSYDFKAHIQKVANGESATYSPFKSIVVG
jgi:eukaryotic-like serine/threonine-protein kinase